MNSEVLCMGQSLGYIIQKKKKKKKWMQDVEMHRCGNRDAYFADQKVTFCYSLTPEQPCPQYLDLGRFSLIFLPISLCP